LSWQEVSDTTSSSETVVDRRQEAVHHGHADAVTSGVENSSMDLIIIVSVLNKDKADHRENVDHHHSKHRRHQQLVTIQSNTLDNVLQLGETIL
jgi:hypothetical protein